MRPSRTDVFPMLVIMAGGAFGALLTLTPVLLLGPTDDVPAPVLWSAGGTSVVYGDANGNVYRADSDGGVRGSVQFSPDGLWTAFRSNTTVEETAEPLWVVDGVTIGTSTSMLESLEPENVEAIEVLKGDAAVRLYGQEASSGVILITLRGTSSRR